MTQQKDPAAIVFEISGGYALSRCLHVIADLGVADALGDAPRTATDLATAVGANPDALGRALRVLAAHGVFECQADAFRHSPASRLLRTDHPQSLRSMARMFGLQVPWASSGALDRTIRSGHPAADDVYPGGFWTFLADHPEASQIFNASMMSKAHGQVAAVLVSYDFGGLRHIGDIGGGHGQLLSAVLAATPKATGVLFDLPHVVAEAASLASPRLTLQGGSFFDDPLPKCDGYLLMEILHDWPDAESLAILRAIRKAAAPDAKLLLIEQVVSEDPGPSWAKMLDIHMLALFGGRQRTLAEYERLLVQAGFALQRVIETRAGVSILEAIARA